MLQTLAKPLGQLNYQVSVWSRNIAGGLLALMVIMLLAQVLFRYVLNDSLGWTEELAKFLMVWVTCLVAPWVYRENLNVSIQMFAEALPVILQKIANLAISALLLVISGLFLLESIDFFMGGWKINASSLPVKLAWFYACAPFLFASIVLITVERLLLQLSELLTSSAVISQGEDS